MKFITINKTQFYRWKQGQLKAKDGALPIDHIFESDDVVGNVVVIHYNLPDFGGNDQPYAVRIEDVREVTEIPNPDEGNVECAVELVSLDFDSVSKTGTYTLLINGVESIREF